MPPHVVFPSDPNQYVGYFENEYAEQLIFVADRKSGEATVQMGDAEWPKVWPVNDGMIEATLAPSEEAWLRACWWAAFGFQNPFKSTGHIGRKG